MLVFINVLKLKGKGEKGNETKKNSVEQEEYVIDKKSCKWLKY